MSSAMDIFTAVYLNIPSVRAANYTITFVIGTWFLNMIDCFDTLGLSILIVAMMLLIGIDETIVCSVKYIRKLKTLEQLHKEYLEDEDESSTDGDDEETEEENSEEIVEEAVEDDDEPASGETPIKEVDKNKIEIENRSDEDEDDDNNKFEIPTCCKRYVSIGVKTADDLIPEEDLEKLNVNVDEC